MNPLLRPPMVVACALLQRNGAFLLCRRAPGQTLAGFWEFPGGKKEQGETLGQCVERELREELSLDVRAGLVMAETIWRGGNGPIRLVALEADLISGYPKPTVHDRTEWVRFADMEAFPLSPADIDLVQKLLTLDP